MRKRRWVPVAAVLAAGTMVGSSLPASAAASAPDSRRGTLINTLRGELNQYLSDRGTAEHISAVGLTITFPGHRDGGDISLAAGTTTYGGRTPVSPHALWQIGSNTKAFTSVMLLQLEAERRLSINDTLGTWLPQYPEWSHITIKNLLDMTSGIPEYTSQPGFVAVIRANPDATFTTAQLASYAYGPPLGSGYAYSNTNYILAQMIIERVTHDSYADQLTKRILRPLRLHDTCFAPYTCPASAAARMPAGYYFFSPLSPFEGLAVPKLNLTFAQGAGGIVTSLQDITTWERALYGGELLPPRQQRELESLVSTQTSQPISSTSLSDPEGYGLGVVQITTPQTGTAWFYEGETFGFRVIHLYLPSSGTLIAIGANSASDTNDDLGSLLLAVDETLQNATPAAAATPATQATGPGLGLPSAIAHPGN